MCLCKDEGRTALRRTSGLLSSFTLHISSCLYNSDGELWSQLPLNLKDCCRGEKGSAFSRALPKWAFIREKASFQSNAFLLGPLFGESTILGYCEKELTMEF